MPGPVVSGGRCSWVRRNPIAALLAVVVTWMLVRPASVPLSAHTDAAIACPGTSAAEVEELRGQLATARAQVAAMQQREREAGDAAAGSARAVPAEGDLAPSFAQLAVKFKPVTDKIGPHRYDWLYDDVLAPYRNQPLAFLEVGLGCAMQYGAGASVPLWAAYFTHPQARIYVLEYDEACAREHGLEKVVNGKAVRVFTGDESDPAVWARVLAETGPLDVVLDDGSHQYAHQTFFQEYMLTHSNAVRAGGLVIVEDIMTSVDPFAPAHTESWSNWRDTWKGTPYSWVVASTVERVASMDPQYWGPAVRGKISAWGSFSTPLYPAAAASLTHIQWVSCGPSVCAFKKAAPGAHKDGERVHKTDEDAGGRSRAVPGVAVSVLVGSAAVAVAARRQLL